MINPKVRDARAVAEKFEAKGGAIIFCLDETGFFAFATYGGNETRCKVLGKIADAVAESIENGELDLN